MKVLRRAHEAQVIAEFLKNEFYHQEFHRDRAQFEDLVMHGDIMNEQQNALRRALLFRRRGAMWRELPQDTQWCEVQLEPADLERIFVFPRAYWRKIANGDFLLTSIVERLRERCSGPEPEGFVPPGGRPPRNLEEFISKIQALGQKLKETAEDSSVLLISTAPEDPLLLFEGNHRLTASLLDPSLGLHSRFRIFLGCSPAMVRCCWYRTSLANLFRYAKNRVLHLAYDREADVDLVRSRFAAQSEAGFVEITAPGKVISPSGGPTNLS